MNKNEMPEPKEEFLKWLESATEKELWSGNYNRATRDEYIAHRVWLHFAGKLDTAIKTLEVLKGNKPFKSVEAVIEFIDETLEELKK